RAWLADPSSNRAARRVAARCRHFAHLSRIRLDHWRRGSDSCCLPMRMAAALRLFAPDDPAVGLRQNGGDRRRANRRAADRGTRDRRKSERRKARLRSLIFSALAFVAPQQLRSSPIPFFSSPDLVASSGPRVSTTIDSFDAIPAQHAYDELIEEAAKKYRLS